MTNANTNVLKYLGYASVYEVLMLIKAYQDKGETAKFKDLMFDARLNPGILNRVLKGGVKHGLVTRNGRDSATGYRLTPHGENVLVHVEAIARAR